MSISLFAFALAAAAAPSRPVRAQMVCPRGTFVLNALRIRGRHLEARGSCGDHDRNWIFDTRPLPEGELRAVSDLSNGQKFTLRYNQLNRHLTTEVRRMDGAACMAVRHTLTPPRYPRGADIARPNWTRLITYFVDDACRVGAIQFGGQLFPFATGESTRAVIYGVTFEILPNGKAQDK